MGDTRNLDSGSYGRSSKFWPLSGPLHIRGGIILYSRLDLRTQERYHDFHNLPHGLGIGVLVAGSGLWA